MIWPACRGAVLAATKPEYIHKYHSTSYRRRPATGAAQTRHTNQQPWTPLLSNTMRQLAQHTPSSRGCISVGYRIPSFSRHSRLHSTAAAAASDTAGGSTVAWSKPKTSTALVRRRRQLEFQGLLLGDMPLPPQQPLDTASPSSSNSSNKGRAVGFGTSSSARQQASQRVGIQPGASCPCKSGLQYQVC